jgi:hypothetical protein
MREDQENNTHGESMKMGFLKESVEIFGEEHLSLDLSACVVCDDALVTEPDALELKSPSRCQSAESKYEKESVNEPDLKGGVTEPKR